MRFPSWIFILFALFWVPHILRWMFRDGAPIERPLRKRGRRALETVVESALSQRDQVIEDLQQRINELESRLDFTERLLAERREPAEIR